MTEAAPLPPEWIERLGNWAGRHERIARLYVFGSRARGDNRPESDLDVAVLLSGDDQDELDGYSICMADRWSKDIQRLLPVVVDLQFTDPGLDERVWPGVVRDGRMVYSCQAAGRDEPLIAERTLAAALQARERVGADSEKAFALLQEAARANRLIMEGLARALVGDTYEMTGEIAGRDELHRIELWARAVLATRH